MYQRKKKGKTVTNGYSLYLEHIEWIEQQAFKEDISCSHYLRKLIAEDKKRKGGYSNEV